MSAPRPRTSVWDLPTRTFHWLLVAGVATALLTATRGRWGGVHVAAGWLCVGLVGFRAVWGLVGERWSRWTSLGREPGHDVAASVSVLTALAGVAALGVSGVVVLGAEEARGPLAGWMSPAAGVSAHAVHGWIGWGLLAWIGVHVGAVIAKSVRERENLVRSMVDGRKRWSGPGVRARRGAAGLVIGATTVGVAWAGVSADRPSRSAPLPADARWTEACGECHLAFHPSLLQGRAWSEMLDPDAEHFGEILGLDEPTLDELRRFAAAEAAEAGRTEHAVRVSAEGFAPLRIVDTETWRWAHASVAPEAFDRPSVGGALRCGACHPDADAATFDARAVSIPRDIDEEGR